METGVVKGPWSEEEDEKLVSYIKKSGHGHWEALARKAGLNRTGKSCRLRWLNYLRPGIRRGNISRQEQLIILQLHSRWGNRWAKIAECLPGRSDNEIKNYWRTRVQKQAKHLRCDVNSHQFRQIMHHIWLPQLAERVQTQPESSPTIRQEFESQPSISDKLSRNSNARSHSDPTPVEAYNPWNENVSEGSNPRAWLGAGEDGDAYQPNRHERIVPCKDFRFESDQEGEIAAAWYDHDNYSLENLLNDEGMMSSRQQLLLDDHQA